MLLKWLTDEKARDQYVIRSGNDTEVLWNDARQLKPELVYKRLVSGLVFSFCSFNYPLMVVLVCSVQYHIISKNKMLLYRNCILQRIFLSFIQMVITKLC